MKHIDDILKEVKKVHFIGIGGAGMCPVAEILISLGYDVTGSDNNDTETFRRIEKEGAKVFLGQKRKIFRLILNLLSTQMPYWQATKNLNMQKLTFQLLKEQNFWAQSAEFIQIA